MVRAPNVVLIIMVYTSSEHSGQQQSQGRWLWGENSLFVTHWMRGQIITLSFIIIIIIIHVIENIYQSKYILLILLYPGEKMTF